MKLLKAGKSVKTESSGRIISILVLGILVISFFSLSIGLNKVGEEGKKNTNTNPDNEKKLESVIGMPISSWFNNDEDPIYIDATATGVGAHNWTWARNQEWCREGDGTQGNPYLIENISIDCLDSGSGIYINNSNGIHFTINNCSVIQSGINTYDGGIRLENTSNGTLVDNILRHNGYAGIVLFNNSDWNLLSNNTANDNIEIGIVLWYNCSFNTISNNSASNDETTNQLRGMCILYDSDSNTVSNNTANDNVYYGFAFNSCDFNKVSNNTANDNSQYGIYIVNYCYFNTVSNNTFNNNTKHGIYLYDNCDSNTISNNTANNNTQHGIYLYDHCDSNTISNNTANNNTQHGIYLYDHCDSNTISNNTANNNSINGIYLNYYCYFSTISNNTANNNSINGIYIYFGCTYNTISNNTANNNSINGINLDHHCYSNTVSNNTANENSEYGIYLFWNCVSNTISNNTANNNSINGIYLNYYCDSNTISNNTANNNSINGINLYHYCYSNTISNNTVNYNSQNGIYLHQDCDSNTIYNNTLYNNNFGIYIQTDSNGNTIYYNILSNLVNNAYDDNINNWDNGIIGNFWSNYTGTDLDRDGIGDTPHEVLYGSGIYDNFPQIVGFHKKPLDTQIEIGTLDVKLIWVVNTYFFGDYNYEITENGAFKSFGIVNEGTSEIMISVDGLEEGRFSYVLTITGATVVYDIANVIVTNSIPEITIPIQEILYEIGSLNNNISWSFTDPSTNSAIYSVFRDEIEILSDVPCNPNENINISIDGLTVGEYTYKVELNDGYDKTTSKIVKVIVNNAAPVISASVVDIVYEIGSLNNNISWSFTDPSTSSATYSVYRDEIEILSDVACNPDESINISIDGHTVGEYTYRVVVNDGYGKTTSKLVNVIVNNAVPVILAPIVDISYEIGSLNNNFSWSFSDISVSNPTYTLYRNGLPILIDVGCNADELIVISVDGLEAGSYIYVIELNDGYGNTITESVTVTVTADVQEEKTDYSPFIIGPTIGVSIIGAAIIIRKKPTISKR